MTMPEVSIRYFFPFYEHLVPRTRVEDALRELLIPVTAAQHVESVLDEVWEDLVTTVEGHSFRMLVREFHVFRDEHGLPMSDSSDEGLQLFKAHLGDANACHKLLTAYPVLRDRLQTILGNTLDAYGELFDAYARDQDALVEAGLLPTPTETSRAEGGHANAIKRIFITGSDPHNDNRAVFGLRLVDDTRLVYKPRALVTDQFVRDLYTAADPYLRFSIQGCAPQSVTVGARGWQEFVHATPMTSEDQPARYFYRFGALCAIYGSIGASDLHDENLLAWGENPCVIDTETVLRPDAGLANDSLPHYLINNMKLSVVSTMLLPMANPSSPIDVVMAGVGVSGAQTSSMTKAVIRDNEADCISVQREPVVYQHGNNVPRLGEEAVPGTSRFEDVVAGYHDALAFVRSDALPKVIDKFPGMPVRCLLRSTMVYGRYIDASTHPDYLAKPEEAARLLGLLRHFPEYLSKEAKAYVGVREKESLATGNVPYFVSGSDSTELATLKDSCPNVYRTSSVETAHIGTRLSRERSDRYHHFILEECLAEIVSEDDPGGLSAHSVFGGPALNDASAGAWWPAIAERITDIGVTYDGPHGPETGWLGGIGPGRGATTITSGNYVSFHDSGGIVTFLERAARYDETLREVHQGADRGLRSLLADYGEMLMLSPEAVFTGAASQLLTQPDQLDEEWLERTFTKLWERAESDDLDTDLVNGPAGLLMVLLSRYAAGAERLPGTAGPLRGQIERLWSLLPNHLDEERDTPWFELAHGELGLRWATARAGKALGQQHAVTESADWLAERMATQGPLPHRGWCNGSAGVLLSAAEIMTAAGRTEWLTARLPSLLEEATSLPADAPVDLSVCHGSSGVVQSLLATAQVLGEDSLVTRAEAYQEQVLRTARANGFYTGSPGRTSLLGYMLGWAGVGDTDALLRAHKEGAADPLPVAFNGSVRERATS